MLNLNDLIFKSAISKEETEQEERQELDMPEDAFSDSSPSEDIEEFEDEEYEEYNEFEDYYCIDDDDYRAFDDMKIRFCNELPSIPDKIFNIESEVTKASLISRLLNLKYNLTECIDLASNYHVR